MKRYSAYGLQIDSELTLPVLLPGSSQPPDVHIRYAPVPENLENPRGKGSYFQASPGTFLLIVDDVARYLVRDGREILIERTPDCREDLLPLYLLGSVFGALLLQRQLLVMHASSVETEHGAALFVGPSGHGKSTLLGALVQRGYAMLSDDVTPIKLEEGSTPLAFSAFPRMRLSPESALKLGYSLDTLSRAHFVEKYLVPVEHFCTHSLPVHAIYTLKIHAAESIQIAPVKTSERFALVGANTYRYAFLEGLGLQQTHFRSVAQVAKTVNINTIHRPASPFLLEQLVDALEQDFGGPITHSQDKKASL